MRKSILVMAALLAPLLAQAGPVDINSADAATIARELNGIGLSKANAIVEYRKEHGSFAAPEDVLNVKGVGPHVLTANKGLIRVEQAAAD
ncbi:MAG: ComEA family DNA-binding protein [Gammaproteobacteria bacterium]